MAGCCLHSEDQGLQRHQAQPGEGACGLGRAGTSSVLGYPLPGFPVTHKVLLESELQLALRSELATLRSKQDFLLETSLKPGLQSWLGRAGSVCDLLVWVVEETVLFLISKEVMFPKHDFEDHLNAASVPFRSTAL